MAYKGERILCFRFNNPGFQVIDPGRSGTLADSE
jgi:hypothetical protein